MDQNRKDEITSLAEALFVPQFETIVAGKLPEQVATSKIDTAARGSLNVAKHFYKCADEILGVAEGGDADPEEDQAPPGVAAAKPKGKGK